MNKIFAVQVPKVLLILGWLTILLDYIMTKFGSPFDQISLNTGVALFVLGAFPVLLHGLKKMSKELNDNNGQFKT